MKDNLRCRVYSPTQNTIANVEEIDYSQNMVCDTNGVGYSIDDVIIQFCTGRKDRNGNLIYQGDIVRMHFESDVKEDDYEDLEVRYDENFMCWGLYDKEHNYFDDSALGADEFKSEDFEIIGNINDGVKEDADVQS
ncbi:MAG: YopX family protein [Cyanobacteriota bacterium]|nr:YopX family protein [Cyanobacteriota bacterium]